MCIYIYYIILHLEYQHEIHRVDLHTIHGGLVVNVKGILKPIPCGPQPPLQKHVTASPVLTPTRTASQAAHSPLCRGQGPIELVLGPQCSNRFVQLFKLNLLTQIYNPCQAIYHAKFYIKSFMTLDVHVREYNTYTVYHSLHVKYIYLYIYILPSPHLPSLVLPYQGRGICDVGLHHGDVPLT